MKKIRVKKSLEACITNAIILTLIVGMFFLAFTGSVKTVFSNKSSVDAIYKGNIEKNNVSLMINVYWGTEYILPMLEVLESENVKTTFFVGGTWANSNCDVLKEIVNRGHEIANHGYYHKDHKFLSYERNQEEIYITHKLIKELTGVEMNLFAPPSGSYNTETLQIANNLGYKTIMWTKDTIDWRDKDSDLTFTRATKNPKNGDLILMHPTSHTLKALPDIIKFYKEKGFNLTTVSQTIA